MPKMPWAAPPQGHSHTEESCQREACQQPCNLAAICTLLFSIVMIITFILFHLILILLHHLCNLLSIQQQILWSIQVLLLRLLCGRCEGFLLCLLALLCSSGQCVGAQVACLLLKHSAASTSVMFSLVSRAILLRSSDKSLRLLTTHL